MAIAGASKQSTNMVNPDFVIFYFILMVGELRFDGFAIIVYEEIGQS